METFIEHQATIWIIFGFLLLAIEAIAFGFGSGLLLFGSLGAIVTGALLWFSFIPNSFVAAVACFAIATAAITGLLWNPLKRMQSGADLGNDRSSDLIGHTFTLASDINATTTGTQKFSGINWRVEPGQNLTMQTIPAGTRVRVSAVSVGVFYVEPDM